MEDFANAIAYEVKQEMANRYFGFRTRIEGQSREYLAKLQEASRELDAAIRLHLCRMQFLLQEPRLFCSFLNLVDLPEKYALNVCSRQSSLQGQELFMAMRGEGFTRWRRFRGLAIIVYHSLAENIATYHDTFLLLQEEHAEICLEINKFQRQNDLSEILSFLRNLDSPDSERLKFLHSNAILQPNEGLEQDLRIAQPPPVTETMTLLPPLIPLKQIKGPFTAILKQAFALHDNSVPSALPF
ncbi:MAG: hypothetical protein KJ630_13580 [Proteobacteria bacterium]|nr:hypothetical protein [Pseudomonadota bacterium]